MMGQGPTCSKPYNDGWERSIGVATAFSAVSDSATVTVTPVNDAPVLLTTPLSLAILPNGVAQTTVGALLASAVTDADAGALQGIAITAVTGNGTASFSVDNGGTFNPLPAIPAGKAFLLRDTDQIQFTPTVNTVGNWPLLSNVWKVLASQL